MMDRLDNPSKMKANQLSEELKVIMRPLYNKHQDDIITGLHTANTLCALLLVLFAIVDAPRCCWYCSLFWTLLAVCNLLFAVCLTAAARCICSS